MKPQPCGRSCALPRDRGHVPALMSRWIVPAAPGAVRERRSGRPDRVPEMRWLAECSAVALREALRVVAPELSGYPVTVPGPAGKQDPQWHSGSEPLGDQFIVKFAWSRPAALQLAHEIAVLAALAREATVPFLPEVRPGLPSWRINAVACRISWPVLGSGPAGRSPGA